MQAHFSLAITIRLHFIKSYAIISISKIESVDCRYARRQKGKDIVDEKFDISYALVELLVVPNEQAIAEEREVKFCSLWRLLD